MRRRKEEKMCVAQQTSGEWNATEGEMKNYELVTIFANRSSRFRHDFGERKKQRDGLERRPRDVPHFDAVGQIPSSKLIAGRPREKWAYFTGDGGKEMRFLSSFWAQRTTATTQAGIDLPQRLFQD